MENNKENIDLNVFIHKQEENKPLLDKSNDAIENKKLRLDLFKFLIGTVALGVITICINSKIQNTQIEIKERETEGVYLEKFLTGHKTLVQAMDFSPRL